MRRLLALASTVTLLLSWSARGSGADAPLPYGAVARLGKLQFHAGSFIQDLRYTADGKSLAYSVDERTIVADAATGEVRFAVEGQAPVYSGDGKFLATIVASGGPRGAMPAKAQPVISEAATGKFVRRIDTGEYSADAVAFSPDGAMMAVACYGGRVNTFEVATGKRVAEMVRKGNWTVGEHKSIMYSPDGKTMVSIFHGLLVVWDVASQGVRYQTPEGREPAYVSAYISPDSQTLLTATTGGGIFSRQLNNPEAEIAVVKAASRQGGGERATAVFSRDGMHVVGATIPLTSTGYPELGWQAVTTLEHRDLATGKATVLASRTAEIYAVALSPDGKTAAVGGASSVVGFYDLSAGKVLGDAATPNGALYACALSPDGKTVALGGVDRTIQLFDFATQKPLKQMAGHEATIVALAFSPDSKKLASSDRNAAFTLWDWQQSTAAVSGKLGNYDTTAYGSACWSPDGSLVAFQRGVAPYVVTMSSGKGSPQSSFWPILTYFGRSHSVPWENEMHPLPSPVNEQWVPTAAMKKVVWSTCTFSPDNHVIAGAYRDTLRLYGAADGAEIRRLLPLAEGEAGRPVRMIRQIGFTPDGTSLVVVQDAGAVAQRPGMTLPPQGMEQEVRVLSTKDWSETQRFRGHAGRVNSLCLAGHYAITASQDGTALVWDLATPARVEAPLPKDADGLWKLVQGEDGEKAAVALVELAKDAKATAAKVTSYLSEPSADNEVAGLIVDLDSADFLKRFAAMQTLAEWRRTRPGTELALACYALRENVSEIGRSRALMLIDGIDPVMNGGSDCASRDRDHVFRLIMLLEKAGDEACRTILTRFAQRLPARRGGARAYGALKGISKPFDPLAALPAVTLGVPTTAPATAPAAAAGGALTKEQRLAFIREVAKLASNPQLAARIETAIAQRNGPESEVNELLGRKEFAAAAAVASRQTNPTVQTTLLQAVAVAAESAGEKKVAAEVFAGLPIYIEFMPGGAAPNHPAIALCRLGRGDVVAAAVDKLRPEQFTDASRPLQLAGIVEAMIAGGDVELAKQMLAKCATKLPGATASNQFVWATSPRVKSCLEIARLQARARDAAGAARTLSLAKAHLDAYSPQDFGGLYPLRAAAAVIYFQAGLKADYAREIQSICKAAQALDQPRAQYNAWGSLALAQADGGDLGGALDTLKLLTDEDFLALGTADDFGLRQGGWTVLAAIGKAAAKSGDPAAGKYFERALNLAGRLPGPQQPQARSAVIAARAQAGDAAGALAMLENAGAALPPEAAQEVARTFARSGDMGRALRAVDLIVTPGLPTAYSTLGALATIRWQAGDLAGALALYSMSPVRDFGGSQLPAVLAAAARGGYVEVAIVHLTTAHYPAVREVAAARYELGDRAGAQRIVERGLEAGVASPPYINEDLWPLINMLGALDPARAAAVSAVYRPRTGPYTRVPTSNPSAMARTKIGLSDPKAAIAQIKALPAEERDRAIAEAVEALLTQTDPFGPGGNTRR